MKMRKFCYFIPIVLHTIIFQGCSDKDHKEQSVRKSPRIKKAISLEEPKKKLNYLLGDDITFRVSHKEDIAVDSVKFILGDQEIIENGNEFTWSASRVGSPSIKITAFYEGKAESVYPKVVIKPDEAPAEFSYKIISEYPHNKDAYTQGLFFIGDTLIESTGSESSGGGSGSSIRKVNYQTGEIYKSVNLPEQYFGEGCAMWENQIFQLTWTSKRAFVYDLDFNQINTYNYPTEGWGLASYGDVLLMSDGSETIYIINPRDFSEIDRLEVYDNEGKVDQLNELEMINDILYANIYGEDEVIGIDPETGQVVEKIDFKGLVDRRVLRGLDYAMNGIAYKKEEKRIFVTGKWWPTLYEVIIIPKSNS